MIKKVGLLLLVLWGLCFSTTLHLIGSLYRFTKDGLVLMYRGVKTFADYRPLRPAVTTAAVFIMFSGIGAA